jgi:hypothetical protein
MRKSINFKTFQEKNEDLCLVNFAIDMSMAIPPFLLAKQGSVFFYFTLLANKVRNREMRKSGNQIPEDLVDINDPPRRPRGAQISHLRRSEAATFLPYVTDTVYSMPEDRGGNRSR